MKLTKIITMFIIAAVITVFSNVYSQSTSMGIEGGINLANLNLTPTFNTNSKTGFMVGGFADIGVSKVVSIKPSVRYIVKGFSQQGTGYSYSQTYSYIEMPLLIKAKLPLNQVKPYIEVGPTVGIQLSASSELQANGQVEDLDQSAFFSAIDFGLYFGSGAEFRVAPNTDIFTSFGYALGLTNISKNTTTAKTNGFQITTGVKFGL